MDALFGAAVIYGFIRTIVYTSTLNFSFPVSFPTQ
jgi:hypothetical protein